ncbi:MAG TPA: hypothetical protein ENK02_02985, partial [Planctomycetes bacterium]|nr:hypothetical protein [Planctomycetota bacterium]
MSYIPPLPYTSPFTGITWEYAIIHLLPGWYADVSNGAPTGSNGSYAPTTTPPVDYYYKQNAQLANGNGETFPIQLPNRVSIQGASALSTVFHAFPKPRQGTTPLGRPVFVFGMDANHAGLGSFISSISIFGAEKPGLTADSNGAIYFGRNYPCSATITNCWIFGNLAGIVVDAPYDDGNGGAPFTDWHNLTITNNTFAWNGCGIWNGQYITPQNVPSRGISHLVLLNNLFDRTLPPLDPSTGGHPAYPWPSGWPRSWPSVSTLTAYEGISKADMTLQSTGGSNSISGNYNAYEKTHFDLGIPVGSLPPTFPRLVGGVEDRPADSIFDLSAITGNTATNKRRGILYIRDLIQNGRWRSIADNKNTAFYPTVTAKTVDFDFSPGDFRLSPAVVDARVDTAVPWGPGEIDPQTQTVVGYLNPLVDKGWAPSTTSTFPLTFANGRSVQDYPGKLPLPSSDQSTWLFHNWDFDCEGFGNPRIHDHSAYPNGGGGIMDIGADEVGDLIVAGQRFGTDHFFDVPANFGTNGTFKESNRYIWFLGPPKALATSTVVPKPFFYKVPYNGGQTYQASWNPGPLPPSSYYGATEADTTPHLLPDAHPAWASSSPKPVNPEWQTCVSGYNPYLFLDPTSGVVNPSGAYPIYPGEFRWLYWSGNSSDYEIFHFRQQNGSENPHKVIIYFDDW